MKKFILVAFAALFVCSAVDAQILRAEELEKYATLIPQHYSLTLFISA